MHDHLVIRDLPRSWYLSSISVFSAMITNVKRHYMIEGLWMNSEQQLSLLDYKPPLPTINMSGETYDPPRDFFRLNKLLARVHDVMLDEGWLTIEEVKRRVGPNRSGKLYGDASLRARHNNFRNHPALRDH